eukprot:2032183-Pleurochrysis_carterae.AAC.5
MHCLAAPRRSRLALTTSPRKGSPSSSSSPSHTLSSNPTTPFHQSRNPFLPYPSHSHSQVAVDVGVYEPVYDTLYMTLQESAPTPCLVDASPQQALRQRHVAATAP